MEWDKKNIVSGVIVIALSNSLSSLNAFYPGFRADGFSGLDAKDMAKELREEHDRDCREIRRVLTDFAIRLNLNEYKVNQCSGNMDIQIGINKSYSTGEQNSI